MYSFKSSEESLMVSVKEEGQDIGLIMENSLEDYFTGDKIVAIEKERKHEAIKSINDWLKHIEDKLIPIILENKDAATRVALVEVLKNNAEMTVKQSLAIIQGLNHHIFQFIGRVRPDVTLCRCLARILRQKLPQIFGIENSVFASQSKKADLAKNISDNFFNKHLRGRTELERTSKIEKEVFKVLKSKPAKKLPDYFDTMPTMIKDWIKHLDENFLEIVLDNMEAATRKEAAISIKNQTKLSPKQNISVIHRINFHAFKFIGAV
jgi:DNA-binding XRE family transcriptional regulator